MQNRLWMQPAVQASEAVLLPALESRSIPLSVFDSPSPVPTQESAFRPVKEDWPAEQPLDTYMPPRGSMAGRSVLRAAGVHTEPVTRSRRKRM